MNSRLGSRLPDGGSASREPPGVSALIANYNGHENLSTFLPRVQARLAAEECVCELIVVDDGSTDDSCELLRRRFPTVRVLEGGRHRGFSAAANLGFREAVAPFVFLLSNDMVPEPGCLPPLLRHLDDPSVFVVSARLLNPDGSHQWGRRGARFLLGELKVWDARRRDPAYTRPDAARVYYHFGCATALYRRDTFFALEGFDEDLFLPFYCEELDLFYRAWKRGWKIVYEPRGKVIHHHYTHGTILHGFERRRVQRIYRRHRLYFNWKNIHDPFMRVEHYAVLAAKLAWAWLHGDREYLDTVRGAWRKRPLVRRKWKRERELSVLSDRAALQRMRMTLFDPSTPQRAGETPSGT